MAQDLDWSDRAAPSLDDFEAMAKQAFDSLPQTFRDLIDDVPFSVDEFPSDDGSGRIQI